MTITDNPSHKTQLFALLGLAVTCIITFYVYKLGLPGQFMFDDYPNLKALSAHGGVHDLLRLKLYLDEAFAGPTGRPISMLSFLIDVREFPADPGALKLKNIYIHILNGVLLFWLLVVALRQAKLGLGGKAIIVIGLLSAAWWMLHPLHVSTVLYAIQRMAQLSALFVLAGLLGYVLGRRKLDSNPRAAYTFMALSLVLGTVLATYSKENGALLPLFALVLEFTLFARTNAAKPSRLFSWLFLIVPSLGLTAYILWQGFTVSPEMTAIRGFTPVERLMTEARILMEYLYYLVIPQSNTAGIFRDIDDISRSLLTPATTLPSILACTGLISVGIWLRSKLPLASTAILFFFAGHLMESTVLPLEPYFEHRNYMASMMLFLPLGQFIVFLMKPSEKGALALIVIISTILIITLSLRTSAWSNRTLLYLTWAEANPTSVRAQLSAANVLSHLGQNDQAIATLERGLRHRPDSLDLHIQLLRVQYSDPVIDRSRYSRISDLAKSARFTNESLGGLRRLTNEKLARKSNNITLQDLLGLWHALLDNPNYNVSNLVAVAANHEIGRIYLSMNKPDRSRHHFNEALRLSKNAETGMMQAAILATNKLHCDALAQLSLSGQYLNKHSAQNQYLSKELDRLQSIISHDAKSSGQECQSVGQ